MLDVSESRGANAEKWCGTIDSCVAQEKRRKNSARSTKYLAMQYAEGSLAMTVFFQKMCVIRGAFVRYTLKLLSLTVVLDVRSGEIIFKPDLLEMRNIKGLVIG